MKRISHAKLLGINMNALYLELPNHPTQIYNRLVHEKRAEAYWRHVAEYGNKWTDIFQDEDPEKYMSQMPEKCRKTVTLKDVRKGGDNV